LLYTPDGGCVNVVVAQDNGSIKLSVADTGPGIPIEERDKVFERFYRLVGSTGGGSGLGLSIVKEVAKNHKATVKIENGENNQGTSVSVLFPSS
jgi:Signal transduction histidine kinase